MASRHGKLLPLAILSALLLGMTLLALHAGDYDLGLGDLFRLTKARIMGDPVEASLKVPSIILFKVRFPRVLLAIGAGLSLGVAGAAYQACFRNPLVEPYILGVSSGAAAGAALAIVFPRLFPQGQLASFMLALLAVWASYGLATSKGETPAVALVLSGIIIGALFSAFVGVMKYLAMDSQLREITFWLMGGLYYATWGDAFVTLGAGIPILVALSLQGWKLNVLTLGDEEAKSLGLNPRRFRLLVVAAATLAAAFSVSTCGIVAWVGLMIPHAARLFLGPDHRALMVGSGILGAFYLLACDTVARTISQAEIPLGIVTSVVGAPYLVWLLRSRGRIIYGS
ncbi:MAG: iron ABC transporter permease [Deltaproteobacteria bacterium]|jgi:iron complex transport system permease protein|nr:iron ABC transporter permease [Deltaproteobacteria bacterium]